MSASTACGFVADLRAGRIACTHPAAGLVPDGVARVEMRRADGTVLTMAEVRNNTYELRVEEDLPPDEWRVGWLGHNGAKLP